jgi:hypothetical protein
MAVNTSILTRTGLPNAQEALQANPAVAWHFPTTHRSDAALDHPTIATAELAEPLLLARYG